VTKQDGEDPIERGRTIVRPKPRGDRPRAEIPAPPPFPPLRSGGGTARPQVAAQPGAITTYNLAGSGLNPLVRAAGPLLLLAARLRRTAGPIDCTDLRTRLAAEVNTFDKRLQRSAVVADQAEAARYALCATLDEAVLSTPWGLSSDWGTRSLLLLFHGEFMSGEKFFQVTERMESDPRRYSGLLEVHYQCLSLGFEGTWATNSQDRQELENIRRRLSERIRALKGEAPGSLSRRWQGAASERVRGLAAIRSRMYPAALLEWANDRILHARRKSALQESPDAASLERRFASAVTRLAKNRVDGRRNRNIPWWVILGAPGSGKTTFIARSELSFVAKPAPGETQDCNWWITDDGAFLDIAGQVDWTELLRFLKSHRRRIQGALLAYSASDLLQQSGEVRDAVLRASHQRIVELNSTLGASAPVYLLLTKMDLVLGFREYFDDLQTEDRSQVWGVTFALADCRSGRAVNTLPAEFDALVGRLHDGLTQRLRDERDPRRRSMLFEFPQQIAALKPRLIDLVEKIARPSGTDPSLFLRGVYFTSGSGPGQAMDAVHPFVESPLGPADPGLARAYFAGRLLREVVLREVGLSLQL
jgi:type IV/VI secretion system ImpK/VasF family protein